ncbi:MAG: translocation/assembly module TamB domain-containing protein, partial [Deltaproteobacteria bacterium]|nr:translocation/assembly module TamB domain-containing protein [Deltaproteobacteria bacterium]
MASPLALTFDVSSPAGEQELRLLGIPTIHARLDPTHVNVVLRDATPNASADVAVNYDYQRGNIVVDRVQFDSYPLKRLASLVSPFHRGARLLDRILLPESNAQGRIDGLRFDGGNATAGKGTLAVAPVSLYGVYAQRLSVDVSASAQQLSLAPIILTANQGRLRADVQLKNDGSLSGDLRSEGFTVESFAGTGELPLGLQGALNVTGKLSGTVDAPQFEVDGELQANALAAEVRGPKSTFAVRGSAENVDAKISLFDSSGSFQIEAPLHSPGESVSLKGSVTRLPIVYLIPQPAKREVPSTQGELDGSVDFRGPLGDPLAGQGAVTISRVRINDGQIAMRESAPFAWKLASGVLSFGETRFSIQERELLLSGEVSHARGWNAQLAGSWELGKFIGEQAGLEQISGTVGIDLDIRGPAYQPAVGGPVRLEDGSISFPLGNTIVGANSVDVDALFVGDRLEITSIAAQVQDGEISGSGMIDHVFDSEQRRISISTKLEAVSTEPIENFFIVLDGQLHLEQQPTGLPILSGDVVISQGSYDATIDLAGIVRAMTNAILGANKTSATLVSAPSRSKSATTALNIRIRADDSVIVDTNVVKALLRGDMVLTGTSDRPLLNGSIDAVEGVFGLRSNQFEIVKGRLLFSEKDQRLDPQIEFISEAQVNSDGEPYLIRLSIGGALSKPRVRFDSDGGLSEREVVALLGGGGGLDRISLLRGSRSASRRVGVLLNPVSNASFEERFVGLTGFTSVEIGPSYSKTTGEYVPKLFARRPLVGELDLELDTELGGDERSTVGVQYPLNNSLRLDVGWQNVPVTKDLSSSSGSFHVGLHYRETFPGYRLFPSFSRSRIVREQDAPVSETPTPPVKESPP